MTVSEAFEHFIRCRRIERAYADQTLAKLQANWASWLSRFLRDIEVSKLDWEDIARLRKAMTSRGLAPSTQSTILAGLRSLLRFCATTLHLDCIAPAEIALPRREKRTPEYLTNQELARIFDALNGNKLADIRLKALIELLLASGLRLGEALALDRRPFDQDLPEMQIIGKGGRQRMAFFNDGCRFWIRHYLFRRTDSHPALFVSLGPQPTRWAAVDVSPSFIRLRKDARIDKHLTPHLLRHTFCTNLRDHGADLSIIKELAGHASIDTTVRYYLGVNKQALRTALAKHLHYGEGAGRYAA
jgi:site-specific recombinase XerD